MSIVQNRYLKKIMIDNILRIFDNENKYLNMNVLLINNTEKNINYLKNNALPVLIEDDVTKKTLLIGKLVKNNTEIIWSHKNMNTTWERLA